MHVRPQFPTSMDPKKEVLPSSLLSQFDLLSFDEKRGTMHFMFHFNETTDQNWCLKFLYTQFTFCTPTLPVKGYTKPLVKNFSRHTVFLIFVIRATV